MSAYSTTLHDEDDNEIYPKTLAENVYDGNTRMDQKVDGIRTDLGSPSSASAVTGADAFSKINTLNSDLAAISTPIVSPISGNVSLVGQSYNAIFTNLPVGKYLIIANFQTEAGVIVCHDNSFNNLIGVISNRGGVVFANITSPIIVQIYVNTNDTASYSFIRTSFIALKLG